MTPRDPGGSSGNSPDPGKPKRASWRGRQAPVSPGRAAAGSSSGWLRRQQKPASNSQVAHRGKLALGVIALVGMTASFLYIVFHTESKTPFLALRVTDYQSELIPPNAWAQEDFKRFDRWSAGSGYEIRTWLTDPEKQWGGNEKADNQGRAALDELHATLAPENRDIDGPHRAGGPNKDVVIIYISAHGVVNEADQPCLLLGRSDPLSSATWLPVESVLRELAEHKDSQGRSVRKILVLDCNRMDYNPSLGLLYNSFFEGLDRLVKESQDEQLVVINSTGPGEHAWASPELGGSVFGYYFGRTVQGDSPYIAGDVSLDVLFRTVRDLVSQWAKNNRSSVQTPQLLRPKRASQDQDFVVVRQKGGIFQRVAGWLQGGEASPEDLLDQFEAWRKGQQSEWSAVNALWRQRDQYAEDPVRGYRSSPRRWGWIERSLLRLEQLLLAGPGYQRDYGKLKDELKAKLAQTPEALSVPPLNLPLAEMFSSGSTSASPTADTSVKTADAGRSLAELWQEMLTAGADDARQQEVLRQAPQGTPGPVEVQFLRLVRRDADPAAAPAVPLALETVTLSEQVATPRDERAQYWLRGAATLDAQRRVAEDLLFVGPPSGAERAARWLGALGFDKLKSEYDAQRGRAQALADAFAMRDRGWCVAPYLVQWLWAEKCGAGTSGSRHARPLVSRDVKADWDRLLEGVDGLRELAVALDDASAGSDDAWQQANTKARLLDDLKQQYLANSALLSKAEGQSFLVEADRALRLPLFTAEERLSLRNKYLASLQRVASESIGKNAGPDLPEAPRGSSNEFHLRLDAQFVHPLLTLIRSEATAAVEEPAAENADGAAAALSALDRLARQGAQVRQSLQKAMMLPADHSASPTGEPVPASFTTAQILRQRAPLSAADWQMRAAAPLLAEAPPKTVDPAQTLRCFDWGQLMAWQCQRTLADFWGPAASEQPSYFESAGKAYLAAAQELLAKSDSPGPGDSLAKQLQARIEAVDKLPRIASRQISVGKENQETTSFDLQLGKLSEGCDVPAGSAAAYLVSDADHQQRGVLLAHGKGPKGSASLRVEVPIPTGDARPQPSGEVKPADVLQQGLGSQVKYRIRLPRDTGTVVARLLYRGHRQDSRIEVRDGIDIHYKPDAPPDPTVAVHREGRGPVSVMFVFDCSASMKAHDVGELNGVKETRYDAAKRIFETVLKKLPAEDFRIGLYAYGHRLQKGGSDKEGRPNPPVLSDYAKAKKGAGLKGVTPGTDAELLFSIGPSAQRSGEMIAKLKELQPWGETPLYFALQQIVKNREFGENDKIRRIVVITDGLDNSDGITDKQIQQVLKTAGDIKLDIILFGSGVAANEKHKLDELEATAKGTDGEFKPAPKSAELLESLRDALRVGGFGVTRAGSPLPANFPELDFSKLWPTGLPAEWREPFKPGPYIVRAVDMGGKSDSPPEAAVTLVGREAIDLWLQSTDGKSRLVHQRYKKGIDFRDKDPDDLETLNQLGRVVKGPLDTRAWVAAHPCLDRTPSNRVTFCISVQNATAADFSPRPKESWVEITPQFAEGSNLPKMVYRFADQNFEEHCPVPVLQCAAPDFPSGEICKQAKIEVWFRLDAETHPDAELEIGPLRQGRDASGRPVDFFAEVTELPGEPSPGMLVTVSEDATEPAQWKLELIGPDGVHFPAVHNYETGRHRFAVPGMSAQEVDRLKLRVTSVKKLKEEGMHAELPPYKGVPR